LVAFRLREAQADRSDSATTTQSSGFQPHVLTSADSLEENMEWKANTTAGIVLTGATLLEIVSFHSLQFISQLTCYAHKKIHMKTSALVADDSVYMTHKRKFDVTLEMQSISTIVFFFFLHAYENAGRQKRTPNS
jgi:hypothetical protein